MSINSTGEQLIPFERQDSFRREVLRDPAEERNNRVVRRTLGNIRMSVIYGFKDNMTDAKVAQPRQSKYSKDTDSELQTAARCASALKCSSLRC